MLATKELVNETTNSSKESELANGTNDDDKCQVAVSTDDHRSSSKQIGNGRANGIPGACNSISGQCTNIVQTDEKDSMPAQCDVAGSGYGVSGGNGTINNPQMSSRISRRTTNVTISLFVISALFITLVLPYKIIHLRFVEGFRILKKCFGNLNVLNE